jgi:transcriptional regulator with XRE-family HTH domain
MSKLARIIIGKNVKAIRLSLNLSQLDFSILTELSPASIVNIESGKNGYNLNLLDNIISFSKFSLSDLSNENLEVSYALRDKLINLYKNSPAINNLLNKVPDVKYAVLYKLLPGSFLDEPKEVNQVRLYFSEFNWFYKGASISFTLNSMPDQILVEKHPSKKNTFVYSKK